jgi:DNA-binding transcriptional ArsR family regulator
LLIISLYANIFLVTDPRYQPDDVDQVFEALAHPARRHILVMLGTLGGELPSGYLAKRFEHSWPTTSRHLKVLEEAGLVLVQREGRSARYRLNRERVQGAVAQWLDYLTPVDPTQTWTSSGPKHSAGLRPHPQKDSDR